MSAKSSLADLRALFRLPLRTRAPLPALPPHPGTFSAGRNAEKRRARADEARLRKLQVARFASVVGLAAPKTRLSRLMINMLANRRLRQRGRA